MPESQSIALVFSALIAAIAWNYATWYVGMPSSSSHAIIGGLVGAGLAAGGLSAINWKAVSETAVAIVASPLVAFSIAYLAMFLVVGWQRLSRWHDNAKPFKALQLVSAAAVSFGHGANDAQKTMGLIAALLVGSGHAQAGPRQDPDRPLDPTALSVAATGPSEATGHGRVRCSRMATTVGPSSRPFVLWSTWCRRRPG